MSIRSFRGAAVALLLAAAAASPALAQRVIHMVVPFGPGAVQDTIARTFNAELSGVSNGDPLGDALRKFRTDPYDPQKLTLGISKALQDAAVAGLGELGDAADTTDLEQRRLVFGAGMR